MLLNNLLQFATYAQGNTPLRHPVSRLSPMGMIHIDILVIIPDLPKYIDLIPEDIRP